MSNEPRRFRKKPVEIEAIQYRPDIPNCEAVAHFLGWSNDEWWYSCDEDDHENAKWTIPTLEGDMEASPGDWIIRGVQGEFYPCKPDIFAATYDPVDPLDDIHQKEDRQ